MNDGCRHAFRLAGADTCVRCYHKGFRSVATEMQFFLISGPDGSTWWAAANEDDALSGYVCGYANGDDYLEFLHIMDVRNTPPPKETRFT